LWCKTCPDKPDDAIDIKNKKCPCGKQKCYGLPGDKKPSWCKTCPDKPGDATDIVNKKCICGKRPQFGLPGGKVLWCKKCKPYDAVDVGHKKCPCGKRPFLTLIGDKIPKWCSNCPDKPREVFDIVTKMCPGYNGVSCPVRTQLTYGKQYCISCDPDETRRLPRKKDEHAFFMFLEKHGIDVTQREYRIDYKCVNISKSHAFIDGVIITPKIVLCLEVDEDAHKSYSCDEARTNYASHELLLAFPGHHIAWIRVNPTIGNFDRSDKALRLRNDRYSAAVSLIRNILANPRTEIFYIGY
jgi:hypothetical protein